MKPEHGISPDGSWECWTLDEVLHREDGPAYIRYENGEVVEEQWFFNGKQLSKRDFVSLGMINQMQAWSLFEPHELMELK